MAPVPITATAINSDGINLTDAVYATLVPAAGNGVSFTYNNNLEIILKNDTGGAAVFTFLTPAVEVLTAVGLSTPVKTVTIATGKTWLVPPNNLFRDPTTGFVIIECDVAGKIKLYSRP